MKDQFAQRAFISVVESGANTLTFEELTIARDTSRRQAFVIHRVEYLMSQSILANLAAADDVINVGLSLSNGISSISWDRPEILDRQYLSYGYANIAQQPLLSDFTNYPGGGIIVPVKQLYGFAQGASLVGAITVEVRIWYTTKDISREDYIELVEMYDILK